MGTEAIAIVQVEAQAMMRCNVGVVGAGYVGLVTAGALSHVGHRVACVDKDEERVALLRTGRVPFYEPGLSELMTREGLEKTFVWFAERLADRQKAPSRR